MGTTLSQLKAAVKQLTELLDDPNPGLFTWNESLLTRLRELRDMANEMDPNALSYRDRKSPQAGRDEVEPEQIHERN